MICIGFWWIYGIHIGDMTAGTQSGNEYSFYASDANTYNYFAGNFGIADDTPDFKLDVKGTICQDTDGNESCDGTVSSDSRLKTNVQPITAALSKIGQLTGVNFNYKQDTIYGNALPSGNQMGFVAQDLELVIPEVIYQDMNGYKMVDYQKITALLTNGINELNQKVENIDVSSGQFKLNSGGYLEMGDVKMNKVVVTSNLDVTGSVKAGSFAFDVSNLNRVGSLATLPVDSANKATLTDALNTINNAIESQVSRVKSLEENIASQSAELASTKDLSSQAVAHADTLDEKVSSTASNLDLLKSKLDDLMASMGLGNGETIQPTEASSSGQIASSTLATNLTPAEDIATDSASLASFSDAPASAKNLTVSESFKSLGESFLGKTTLAGDFTQDGTFSITGGNEINVIGSPDCIERHSLEGGNLFGTEDCGGVLYLQRNQLAQAIDIFDGKVFIDNSGAIRAQSVTVAEFKVVANKISGSGTIKAGQKSVTIPNTLVSQTSRILITPTSNDAILAVTQKLDHTSFTVSTAWTDQKDVTFDWWMITEVPDTENNIQ